MLLYGLNLLFSWASRSFRINKINNANVFFLNNQLYKIKLIKEIFQYKTAIPVRSSWNSSSSESSIRSSTNEDWRDKFWNRNKNIEKKKLKFLIILQTELWRRRGGDRLFHSASNWSKCCDCANAACSGHKLVCDCNVFISAIFEISSMLADTEKRRFSRSSTWAIITDDVKWPYFFCQVYVSNDTSFFSKRRICFFGPTGRRSEKKTPYFYLYRDLLTIVIQVPSTSLAGAE